MKTNYTMTNEPTHEEKSQYLRTHGWHTLWSEDNWIEEGIEHQNLDHAGCSTDVAYYSEINRGIDQPHTGDWGKNYYDKDGNYISSEVYDKENKLKN